MLLTIGAGHVEAEHQLKTAARLPPLAATSTTTHPSASSHEGEPKKTTLQAFIGQREVITSIKKVGSSSHCVIEIGRAAHRCCRRTRRCLLWSSIHGDWRIARRLWLSVLGATLAAHSPSNFCQVKSSYTGHIIWRGLRPPGVEPGGRV